MNRILISLILLTSCSQSNRSVEIVQEYFHSSVESKPKYLAETFELELSNDMRFNSGEESEKIAIGIFETRILSESKYESVKFDLISNDKVEVSYQLKGWMPNCLGWDKFTYKDLYTVKNGLIVEHISFGHSGSDSTSKQIQNAFHSWTKTMLLEDSIKSEETTIKHLKSFCESDLFDEYIRQ